MRKIEGVRDYWPYCGAAAANAGGGPVGRSPTGLNTNRHALVAACCDPAWGTARGTPRLESGDVGNPLTNH